MPSSLRNGASEKLQRPSPVSLAAINGGVQEQAKSVEIVAIVKRMLVQEALVKSLARILNVSTAIADPLQRRALMRMAYSTTGDSETVPDVEGSRLPRA